MSALTPELFHASWLHFAPGWRISSHGNPERAGKAQSGYIATQ